MQKQNTLVRSFSVVLFVSILAKITAFFSEVIIATYLGTSFKADAFNMIHGIHQVFYPMLSVGIWTVFLPEYKKQLTLNRYKYADELANKMLNLFLLASIIFTVIIIIFTNAIVTFVAPGFEGRTKQLTIMLVKISAPQYIFIVISAFYASMLQAHDKFFASQFREVVTHIPVILFALFLYKFYGTYVLALGLLVGSVFRLLVQIPFINWGYKYHFRIKLDSSVIKLLKRVPSALITAAVTQLNSLVDKIMASNLRIGSVSSLSYGQKLINVFSGLITGAITTVIYPVMAEKVAENNMIKLKELLIKSIYLLSSILLPITFVSILYSKDIVSIIFQRGAFDSESVHFTSLVFSCYSIGILFTGLKDIFNNFFYSFGDTKTTMKISLFIIGINIGFNFIFIKPFGVAGLALASSISIIIGTVMLFVKIKQYVNVEIKDIWQELTKILLVSIFAFLTPYLILNMVTLHASLKIAITCIISFFLYFIGLKHMKSTSFDTIIEFLREKIGKE